MTLQCIAEWVPKSLDTMEPGHELACLLAAINVDNCTGFDRIRVLKAHERMRSFYSARVYQAMNAVADAIDPEDMPEDLVEKAAAAEVAAALKWTRQAADSEMALAADLRRRLPEVWRALVEGRIDARRAKVMVHGTTHLPDTAARAVVEAIIESAHRYTTGQLKTRLRKLCIDADPDEAARRYQTAVADRRVTTEADESGTAHLFGLDLPPDRLEAGLRHINNLAKSLRRPGETRTIDQLRADVLLDLMAGASVAGSPTQSGVIMHTTLESLAGLSEHPGELAGYGPVIADIARQVADRQHNSRWEWIIEDEQTGLPLATGTTRRRPTAAQQRAIEARHPTCIHPGCRMPAVESDIDHRVPWAERRETRTDNLAPLCRHHHRIKHQAGWNYQPVGNGDYVFTTQLGHTYTTSGRSP